MFLSPLSNTGAPAQPLMKTASRVATVAVPLTPRSVKLGLAGRISLFTIRFAAVIWPAMWRSPSTFARFPVG